MISDLLPAQTKQIHEVILEASGGRPRQHRTSAEVVLDVESLEDGIAFGDDTSSRRLSRASDDAGSCKCFQCNYTPPPAAEENGDFSTNAASGGVRKSSKTSMIADENSNLVSTGKR